MVHNYYDFHLIGTLKLSKFYIERVFYMNITVNS